MSIICISHDSYSHGQEVAERVAKRLECDCIGREMVQKAADAYSIRRARMEKSVHDAPSLFDSFSNTKASDVDLFKAALLRHVESGRVVYHGLAGHIMLAEAPKVFKVRIVADNDTRLSTVMERDGLNRAQALSLIKHEDAQRLKWSKRLYGVDNHDPSLYNLCLNLAAMSVDEAVETILEMAQRPAYQMDSPSLKRLEELVTAAEVEAELLKSFDSVHVDSHCGGLFVRLQAPLEQEKAISRRVSKMVQNFHGTHNAYDYVSVSVDISTHA